MATGLAKGEVVHIDSSLVRADAGWEAIARRYADAVEVATAGSRERRGRAGLLHRPRHQLDDQQPRVGSSLPTSGIRRSTPRPACETQLDTIQTTIEAPIGTATMDASYARTHVCAALEACGIEAVIPAKAEHPSERSTIIVWRFKLDAKPRILRCLAGTLLRPHGMTDSDGFSALLGPQAGLRALPPACNLL